MLHLAHKVAGVTVSGTDGEIGTLEDFYFDEAGWTVRYLLVDTGTWFKGKRVLLSPRWVQSDWGRDGVHVNLTRDEVWNSADADERHARADAHLDSVKETSGYHIHARNGEIGHVDDFLIGQDNWRIRYLLVDTSNWIGGRSVIVSSDALERMDKTDKQPLRGRRSRHDRARSGARVDRGGAVPDRDRPAVHDHLTASDLRFEQRRDRLEGLGQESALPPGLELDALACAHVGEERLLHLLAPARRPSCRRSSPRCARTIGCRSSSCRSRPTGRRRPSSSDAAWSCCIRGLNARPQQLPVESRRVLARQPVVVVLPGDHDPHIHATSLRLDERVDRRLIGDEVGIGDVDRSTRADDGQVVHDAHG